MKALVVEIRDKQAAVLDKEGIVRIVENQAYEIGQEIEVADSLLEDKRIAFPKKYRGAMKAAAAVAIMVSGIMASVMIPSASIRAKGVFSLTYRLNIWNRVIRIEAGDQTGKEIKEQISIGFFGENIDDVMSRSFDLMEDQAGEAEIGSMEFETETSLPFQEKKVKEEVDKYQKDWEERKENQEKEVKSKDGSKEDSSPADGKKDKGDGPEEDMEKAGPGKDGGQPAQNKANEAVNGAPDKRQGTGTPADSGNPPAGEAGKGDAQNKMDQKPGEEAESQNEAGQKPGEEAGGQNKADEKPGEKSDGQAQPGAEAGPKGPQGGPGARP